MRSLDKILSKITQQPEWQEYQQYQQVLKCWYKEVVNRKISQNTRPIYFSRGVLGIATSSAVWAQELNLQRYSFLKKLNKNLNFQVKDIRFTPAPWHDLAMEQNKANNPKKNDKKTNIGAYSTKLPESNVSISNPKTVHESLQNWLDKVKMRSQVLPLCPQCNSPTPQEELKRWHLCCHCMSREKHLEYCSTRFFSNNSLK